MLDGVVASSSFCCRGTGRVGHHALGGPTRSRTACCLATETILNLWLNPYGLERGPAGPGAT